MAEEFYTGDTVRIRATFTDSTNALADPDSNEAYLKIYDADEPDTILLEPALATRSSQGIYYYDYTMPSAESNLVLEMNGLFATKPQLVRTKVKARFR